MICRIVRRNKLHRVPRKLVPAVIIYCLHSRKGEEAGPLTDGHACDFERDASTQGVEQKSLQGVVVKSSIRVRHIESVVPRVESS